MAQKESSFNPSAVSPTGARGLFQFTGGTGRQYGLIDRAGDIRDNPTANTQAFVRFTEDNRNALRQGLGREPTHGELALAHQQGAGGALALLTGRGDIDPNNLRVNNIDPSLGRSAQAQRIMAYYGYDGSQPPAQSAGVQAAAAPAGVQPVAGDDPAKLRADAQFYEKTNPEAARQFRARADAAGGTRVAEADAPNMPDRSAVNAQGIFIPPGNSGVGTVQPNPANPPAQSGVQGLSQRAQLILRTLANPYLPEGPRDALKVLLAREMKTDELRSIDGGTVTHMVDSAGRIRATIPKTTNPLDDEEKRGRIALQNKQLANEDLITFDVDGQKHVYNKRTKQTEAITPGREASAARAGLKPGDPGYQSFILTGKMPREDAGPLSATDKKAILEADELVLSNRSAIDSLKQAKELSAKAYEGPTASLRGTVMGNFGNDAGKATMEYNNLVTSNALSQLKATFGAAPTEGERKILLEIQGSASLPHDVRMKILDRGIAMAEKRMAFNEQRAKELRGGDYYKSPEKRAQGEAAPRQQQSQPGQPSRQPDTTQARQAPDGNWYVPDPNRPGKYLQVQ